MSKTIKMAVSRRVAEIRLAQMAPDDPFRDAYETFLRDSEEWLDFYDKQENGGD